MIRNRINPTNGSGSAKYSTRLRPALSILPLFALTFILGQKTGVTAADSLVAKGLELKVGDIAPSWALMYAPGQYEFLKTWTAEKGLKLRKIKTQPHRHVVVLSFFATWCSPCIKELPHLQNLYEKYRDKRVKFFIVDITEATRSTPALKQYPEAGSVLAKKGITIPGLYDNSGIVKDRYGVVTLPRLFVIDKYQTIRLIAKGYREGSDFESDLSGLIDQLLIEDETEKGRKGESE